MYRAGMGRAPACTAAPTRNTFVNWSSPSRAVVSARASTVTACSARVSSWMRATVAATSGNATAVSRTMAPVGTREVQVTAMVRSGAVTARFTASAATRRSQPR